MAKHSTNVKNDIIQVCDLPGLNHATGNAMAQKNKLNKMVCSRIRQPARKRGSEGDMKMTAVNERRGDGSDISSLLACRSPKGPNLHEGFLIHFQAVHPFRECSLKP
jgi:hypothetical protein